MNSEFQIPCVPPSRRAEREWSATRGKLVKSWFRTRPQIEAWVRRDETGSSPSANSPPRSDDPVDLSPLEAELRELFEEHPLEDGIAHPADSIIARVVRLYPRGVGRWSAELVIRDTNLAANFIRSVARMQWTDVIPFGATLIRVA